MSKSADAFRTISEVAEWLDTPAHVLRFWESKFTQVKPVKRAGGRRYYRPADMRLLGGIKKLLHEDGMTIKGVQKILREQGIKHVSSLCTLSLGDEEEDDFVMLEDVPVSAPVDTVIPFEKPAIQETPEPPPVAEELPYVEDAPHEPADLPEAAAPEIHEDVAEVTSKVHEFDAPEPHSEPEPEPLEELSGTVPAEEMPVAADDVVSTETSPEEANEPVALPGFLQHSMDDRRAEDAEEHDTENTAPEPAAPPAEIEPVPGALTHLSRITRLSAESARQIAPVAEQLKARVG